VVVGLIVVLVAFSGRTTSAPNERPTILYADADWYRVRPETEQDWRGTLKRREVVAGPGARTALRYTLATASETLAVYDPSGARLERFVGREVVVRGKRVDLTAEGFGPELWAASIRRYKPPRKH
jgi:hypothetical protein